jgi:hypothetical protein
MLEQRYHGVAWPHRRLVADPETLMEGVIARVNRTSALWHQFGFLCDLIVIGREGEARYYEELPVDYVRESEFGAADSYFTITLEYGPDHDTFDPFDVSVGRVTQSETERSDLSRYLHPVVRHVRGGALVGEHHVTENLENNWTGPTHREPLQAFFARELPKGALAEPAAV